jgi:hypothetical protein
MLDPYGSQLCQYCTRPSYDTEAKDMCPGPSIEQMHENLKRNLKLYNFREEL